MVLILNFHDLEASSKSGYDKFFEIILILFFLVGLLLFTFAQIFESVIFYYFSAGFGLLCSAAILIETNRKVSKELLELIDKANWCEQAKDRLKNIKLTRNESILMRHFEELCEIQRCHESSRSTDYLAV